jgi:hypothetical protein
MEAYPWFVSARRILDTVFPGDKGGYRLADLGCLEGGYAVEFARMGFQVVGIEVREANIAACRYVKANTNLPNLEFVRDNAWNVAQYGPFDAVFCCGLLYHLDRPRRFLEAVSAVTTKLLILQTHFSTETGRGSRRLPRLLRRWLSSFLESTEPSVRKNALSNVAENESVPGRWYREYASDARFRDRERYKWSAWDNRRSFWVQREYLLQIICEVGFDLVLEQYDSLGPRIADAMIGGFYKTDSRGTFIGIKTQKDDRNSRPASDTDEAPT